VSTHRGPGRRPSLPSFLAAAARRPGGVAGSKPAEAPPSTRRPSTVQLKSPREIALMREAGRLVARAHEAARVLVVPGATTADLDAAVAAVFREAGAEPLFLNYPCSTKGKPPFPAVICSSVNEQVVHGIPNKRPLKAGDVVAVDTGCRLDGWCGDSAFTWAVGPVAPEVRKLLDATADVLQLAVRAMGRCRWWSEVATLMEQYVRSQGFSVIENFVGHGIGKDMHEEPQVPNFVSKALRKHDIRLEPGVVLAVEPMVAMGAKEVRTLDDGWTVETKDRRPSAHFEHTIAITADGPEILTLP